MIEQPWPESLILNQIPSKELVSEFEDAVKDARDERPLQTVLATNPVLLRPILPAAPRVWCFDRPKFGGELVPDFLLCYHNSTGFNWLMVEIESPTKKALTEKGTISAGLADATRQIRDWRVWLRQNIAYANQQLKYAQIDAECPSVIIIGRRGSVPLKHALQYRELSNGKDRIMSYDRLIEVARGLCGWEYSDG